MTDEQLIEEAAKAVAEYQGVRYDAALKETWDGMARAALAVFEKAHVPTDDERKVIAQVILPAFDQLASSVYHDGPYSEAESALEAADLLIAAGFRRSEVPGPQGEPSDAQALDNAEALSDLLDEMNEAGVMPELPFRDAQDIAGVAYLVDEGDTTRAVFLSDPGEDRVQYDGHSEDDASYVGLFERPIDELHGPITVLRAAEGVR